MEDNNNNHIPDQVEDRVKEYRGNRLERFEYLEQRLQEIGTHTSVAIELVVAVLVFVACVFGIFSIFPSMAEMFNTGASGEALIEFLESVFTVVVGIEFLKMLCKPTSENVLETIIFLIARHMIIGHSTATEDLFYVIAIVLLVITKIAIVVVKKKLSVDGSEM